MSNNESSDIPNNPCDNTINDAEEDFASIDESGIMKRRGEGLIYELKITLTQNELEEELKPKKNNNGTINQIEYEDLVWKYKYKRNTQEGVKIYYKCSSEKHTCPCLIYLINISGLIKIYQSEQPHSHSVKQGRGIKPCIKEAINKLYDLGTRAPKNILRALEKDGIGQPTKQQLRNHLNKYKGN